MKISIICHDLSNNALGRAYIIAKMIQQEYEVEVIGPVIEDQNKPIWEPVANDTSIKYTRLENTLKSLKSDLQKIDGDVIYSIKPKVTSYGYALLKKLLNRKKVLLDEDDYDIALIDQLDLITKIKNSLRLFSIHNPLYHYLLERLISFADGVTVSSPFLQEKYGGIIIPHVRSSSMINVEPSVIKTLRDNLKLKGHKVIVFMGTVRQHKGIDTLVNALDTLKLQGIKLLIVGVSNEQLSLIPSRDFIITVPPQPFEAIARFVSLADLVVIPQKNIQFAQGQTPAKLIDAMAMGKAIIASEVGPIPSILKNCGLIFKPDNVAELANKIRTVLDDDELQTKLGKSAREKFMTTYSTEVISPVFLEYVRNRINN